MYLKIEKFQGLECVCCDASLSLGSHLAVDCTDAVPVAEGQVQGVLLGLSCLHITDCREFTSAGGIFPRVLLSNCSWGFWGKGGGGALSLGGRSGTEPVVVQVS